MQSKILFCKAKALDGTSKLHFFKGLVNCKKKKKKKGKPFQSEVAHLEMVSDN